MARGTALSQLVSMFRAETHRSMSVAAGVDALDAVKELLRRTQEMLYDEYDWPFLRVMTTKTLAAGSRYYDVPADLNLERIDEVQLIYSGEPRPISHGISFAEYATFDSDSDERSDPVLAWDLRWTGSATQIEVWPIPASSGSKLWFRGIRKLRALTSDSDVADLDDRLIVLYAAAETLAAQDSKDAQAKLSAARDRLSRMKGRAQGPTTPIALGQGRSRDAIHPRARVTVSS